MRKIIKVTPLILLLLIAFSPYYSFAQENKKPQVSRREAERRKMHARDALIESLNKLDTSVNSRLQLIERYTTTFNQINNSLAEGIDTADISQDFPPVLKRLNKIDSLANTHKSSTLRYLFVLRDNLDHMEVKLKAWQSDIEGVSAKLISNQNELIKFAKDTSLKIIPADSLVRVAFFAQRRTVRQLFHQTDSLNRANLLKVNLLQDRIAVAYTKILDESDHIDTKIGRFAMKAVDGESDYIWNTGIHYDDFKPALNSTIHLNKILFNYFIKNETYTHLIGILFLVLIFAWIFFVRAKTLRCHENPETILSQANYINKHYLLAPLLVAVAVIPYFYSHPPVVFLETLFALSMVLTLIMVKKEFPGTCFKFLRQLFLLAVIYGVSNLFIQISNIDRYVILLLSVFSILTGLSFYRKVKTSPDGHHVYTIPALKIFIGMQSLSLLLNITGRFSLAKIIGVTAIFNLWFLVILFFVVQIIIQGLFLQFQVKKEGNSFLNWIDYNIVQKKFRNVLFTLAAMLWAFFLLQNLNIDDWVRDNIHDFLNQKQTVGGASFTFEGFVIFIAVIWVSSILSRLISYFYDVSAQRGSDLSIAKKRNRTSTLLIRLGVFSIGFLLAVAASGFPLEKLTIIISAFGIGIGFGLQNIVNNLVSGVILAFEKPIQIGDTIEVDNRSGVMTEIGIRSSKILTSDGSEVIIPNGDLISHHVVNWTLSNSNRRVELAVMIAYGEDINKVKDLLLNLLKNREDVMKDPGPSVFLNKINESTVEFKIFFWADDINTTLELKSRVIADIDQKFITNGIRLPSAKKDLYLHFPDGTPDLNQEEKIVDKKDNEGGKEVPALSSEKEAGNKNDEASVKDDLNETPPDQDQ
ncbi:MAG: mechanosensitive ion channel family protein [Mucilaginibacter sp.]